MVLLCSWTQPVVRHSHTIGCKILRYRALVFKGCDDHNVNFLHAEFSCSVIHLAKTDARFCYMLHVTCMGNAHATPYWMLERIRKTLLKQLKPEWITLWQRLSKPAGKGTRIVLCSLGRFVTFECWAHTYIGHVPGVHELLPQDDDEVLNDDDVAFVISPIASFCQSFWRVFLKGTQRHGRVQVGQYNTWG